MNLISCDCGVVLDKDKLPFPEDVWTADGSEVDLTKAAWDGDRYTAFVKCPVCGEPVMKNA